MSGVVQHTVVDGLPDVAYGPLWVVGSNDFMSTRRVFVGGQDANLPPRHLLFVDVNRLVRKKKHILTDELHLL